MVNLIVSTGHSSLDGTCIPTLSDIEVDAAPSSIPVASKYNKGST